MIRNQGSIVNISSIWGVRCFMRGCLFGFREALIALQSSAKSGISNIRVNAIACGVIDTQMNNFMNEDEKRAC